MSLPTPDIVDQWLFGWDDTPGIVSVWADRRGRATMWQRRDGRLVRSIRSFRPWILATTLADVRELDLVSTTDTLQATAAFAVQELSGDGGLRFLLSARDGRTLEQTIIGNASKRLGRTIRHIAALDEYYGFAPVDQYLIQTGQTYFCGLHYDDLHRMQFDLETTALEAEHGRIFMIAIRDNRGFERVLEAANEADEAAIIAELCAIIRERDPDVLENHNLFGFDLPYLQTRAHALNVPLAMGRAGVPPLLSSYQERGNQRRQRMRFQVAGRELIDTLEAVWRHDFVTRNLSSYSLKVVAQAFGVATADRVYLPGHAVYKTYQTQPDLVRRYALDDVREVAGLSQRLLGASFALANMAPRSYERAAAAGTAMGLLEPMLIRAYLHAGVAMPHHAVGDPAVSGDHAGGATHLLAAGVAQRVVKTDIASMYPSIMRVYQIGSSCDSLNVLLALVDRLTTLRLQHKRLMRDAPAGSRQAHEHDALQAAMKLMINSAYGYMGAGRMAMFADRHAADTITRIGREILEQVEHGLAERGMALLEADTDGVYFAAPLDWNEAQERAVVAEVAATLPGGIRLEYEGRYAAMLSHEVKNYALLTYDGRLIVRGVALRSSRAEPFGEQFLAQAVRCLLEGDVVGIQKCYQATIAALRQHDIPLADVAARVRLSKTPAEYHARRAKLREAAYEALIAAGHDNWKTGERIRVYRSVHGQDVWLPDDANEADFPPYDSDHAIQTLRTSYASRLRKAFAPEDFDQVFREGGQQGLFDQPISTIEPLWIRASRLEAEG